MARKRDPLSGVHRCVALAAFLAELATVDSHSAIVFDELGPAQHLELGLSLTSAQEQSSKAFLIAVASLAGCSVAEPRPDDSIDWTLSCRLKPRRPKPDLQVKSTGTGPGRGEAVQYKLKRKNYDDLILSDLLTPRILVLVIVPPSPKSWLIATPDALVLRHAAYRHSLCGLPGTTNESTVTVQVPRANLFDVTALTGLMRRINEGGVA